MGKGDIPTVPKSVPELKQRISDALQTVSSETLQYFWKEMAFRNNISLVTKERHIKNL